MRLDWPPARGSGASAVGAVEVDAPVMDARDTLVAKRPGDDFEVRDDGVARQIGTCYP